jgi:hypothetical protein
MVCAGRPGAYGYQRLPDIFFFLLLKKRMLHDDERISARERTAIKDYSHTPRASRSITALISLNKVVCNLIYEPRPPITKNPAVSVCVPPGINKVHFMASSRQANIK